MPKPKILQESKEYTFRSYFEMTYEPEEILAEFGYSRNLRSQFVKYTR